MLDPFAQPLFLQWCQTNPLLTGSNKDSADRMVIMDLSWPLPPEQSVNGGTPMDQFLGVPKMMHLPSAGDLCSLIHKSDKFFVCISQM